MYNMYHLHLHENSDSKMIVIMKFWRKTDAKNILTCIPRLESFHTNVMDLISSYCPPLMVNP